MELRKFIATTIREYLNEQEIDKFQKLKVNDDGNITENKLIQTNLWYHGTDEIFDYPKYINSGREIGFHLGNLEQALNIKNKIKNNYPKYINKYEIIDLNPLRMKDLKFWLPEYIADELIKKGFNVEQSGKGMWGSKFYKPEDVLEVLKSEGFDSIIYENEFEGDGDSIIVFDNAKIKFLGREKIKQKDCYDET